MSRGEIYKSGWGSYRLSVASGAIGSVAGNGHLFAAQWSGAKAGQGPNDVLVTKFRATWLTTTGFTAGQEVGLELDIARGFTAPDTGGTALAPTAGAFKLRGAQPSPYQDSLWGDMRISSGTALGAGTLVLDPFPFANGGATELAAAATVQMQKFDCIYDGTNNDAQPIRLSLNEGIILRNRVAMGAGGAVRLFVEMDWIEIPRTFQ